MVHRTVGVLKLADLGPVLIHRAHWNVPLQYGPPGFSGAPQVPPLVVLVAEHLLQWYTGRVCGFGSFGLATGEAYQDLLADCTDRKVYAWTR